MPKLSSRQVKFASAIPAQLSDMKDGEFRFTRDGIISRQGGAAYSDYVGFKSLYMDPALGTGALDDLWAITNDKGVGSSAYDNGRIKLVTDAAGSGSRIWIDQDDIAGIMQSGEFYFDIWGRITGSPDPDNEGNGSSIYHKVELRVDAAQTFSITLNWDGGTQYYVAWSKAGTGDQSPAMASGAPGANIAYWRARYQPGDDGVRLYWQYGDSPLNIGWREIKGGLLVPSTAITYFRFQSQNGDAVADRTGYFEMWDWARDGFDDAMEVVAPTDGQMRITGATWDLMRAKTEADTVDDDQIKSNFGIGYDAGGGYLSRPYFRFDLDELNLLPGKTITKAFLRWYNYSTTNQAYVTLRQFTGEFPLVASDWDSFTGPILMEPFEAYASGVSGSFIEAPLNADGLAYLNSVINGKASLAMLEYDHDYLDVDPEGDAATGLTWYDYSAFKNVYGIQLFFYLEPEPGVALQIQGNRQVIMDGNTPTSVEQMSAGELRVSPDGIFGRIDDTVYNRDWMRVLLYDYFEDDVLDPVWDLQYQKTGGTVTEENGDLVIEVNSGGSSFVVARQPVLKAIERPGYVPLPEVFYFDVWGKMTFDDPPGGSANAQAAVQMQFLGITNTDNVYIELRWDNGLSAYRVWIQSQDGVNTDQGFVSQITDANEAWWRFRYLPGDSQIRLFWRHGLNPHQHGWAEYATPTSTPSPDTHIGAQFDFKVVNSDGAVARTARFNQLGNWLDEEITTTTTTTTTTTACPESPLAWIDGFDDSLVTPPWTSFGTPVESGTLMTVNGANEGYWDLSAPITSDESFRIVAAIQTDSPVSPGLFSLLVDDNAPNPTLSDRRFHVYASMTDKLYIEYRDTSDIIRYWNGATWQSGIVDAGITLLNMVQHRYELVIEASEFYLAVYEMDGTLLTITTSVPLSSLLAYTDLYFVLGLTSSALLTEVDWFGKDSDCWRGPSHTLTTTTTTTP